MGYFEAVFMVKSLAHFGKSTQIFWDDFIPMSGNAWKEKYIKNKNKNRGAALSFFCFLFFLFLDKTN